MRTAFHVMLLGRLVLLVAVTITPACDAAVDGGLVGAWEQQVAATPFNQELRTVFEFRDDGSYVFHDAANAHAGTWNADARQWSLKSETNRWEDGGSYRLVDRNTLELTGRFGPSRWQRRKDPPYFATVQINGQPIPVYVPLILARTWIDVARPWRPDAIPVGLDVQRSDRNGQFLIRARFVSPAAQDGLAVDILKYQRTTFEQRRVDWGERAMPLKFVDLPAVIDLSTNEGKPGPYKRFYFEDSEPGWGWGVDAERVGPPNVFFITHDGRVDRSANWEYGDYYEEYWNRAAASIQSLFGLGGGEYQGDAFWRDMCARAGAGRGGSSYDPGTSTCY
jgi:hypothetical protein